METSEHSESCNTISLACKGHIFVEAILKSLKNVEKTFCFNFFCVHMYTSTVYYSYYWNVCSCVVIDPNTLFRHICTHCRARDQAANSCVANSHSATGSPIWYICATFMACPFDVNSGGVHSEIQTSKIRSGQVDQQLHVCDLVSTV